MSNKDKAKLKKELMLQYEAVTQSINQAIINDDVTQSEFYILSKLRYELALKIANL